MSVLPASHRTRRAFTLLEVLMAISATAVVLAAIYGLFSKTVHLRNDAVVRTREARLNARALDVLANDLRHAVLTGGTLGATLTGSRESHQSNFRGYLQFTTTAAPELSDAPNGDIQQVEYYVTTDPAAADLKSGVLVRAVERNLLAPVREEPREERLLTGVTGLEVTFYDGQTWQETWEYPTAEPLVPEAVRVRIMRAGTGEKSSEVAPLEMVIPWSMQPAVEPEVAVTPAST